MTNSVTRGIEARSIHALWDTSGFAKRCPRVYLSPMRWLNYHHLYYFWSVAKAGSVTQACRKLRLSQPAVSAQIRSLEETLGDKLFERHSRGLRLTELGRLTFKYADEIFALGGELLNRVKGSSHSKVPTLHVGIADVVPKFLAYRLIEPALRAKPKPHIVIHEDKSERLISELGTKELDVVISDSPMPHHSKVKAYNHFLGECGITFMATEKIAKQYQRNFPASLHGAPLMLPSDVAAVRRELNHWFEQEEVEPEIVAEFQDTALMKTFARKGHGILPLPVAVEREVMHEYGLRVVGRVDRVKERFYLISVERRVKHPSVLTICEQAHERLFGA